MFLILLLTLYVLTGVFVAQNGGTQDFNFLGYSLHLPAWAPAVAGVGAASALLLLHMGSSGVLHQVRLLGHSRKLDEHRALIWDLRESNSQLREELAAARGSVSRSIRPSANGASWFDRLRERFQSPKVTS
jgi:hypothetical protein